MISEKLRQIQAVATAPTNPAGLSGLTVWLKADAGVIDGSGGTITANGTAIATWQNQASGGTHYNQATSGFRPTYRDGSNGKNGLPVIDFNGASTQSLTHADMSAYGNGGITIFTICKWTSGQVWSANDGGGGVDYPIRDYYPRYITGGDGVNYFATTNDNSGYTGWNFIKFASNVNASYEFYPYGTPSTITTAGFASRGAAQTNDIIGKHPYNADYLTGQIGEIIIYNRKLTDTECASIKTYLLNRWGMASIDNVSLLLHMDGTNNSTTFTDSGPNSLAVTAVGDAKISTALSKFGGASAYFDGTGDYLTVASHGSIAFGLGDFTIECWVNFSASPTTNTIMGIANTMTSTTSATTTMWWFGLEDSAGTKRLRLGRHGDAYVYAYTNWTPSLNTWYFLQATRSSGSTIKLGINGILQSVTSSGSNWANDFSSTGTLAVGYMATVLAFNGNIDDFRLTKGVARTITLPTGPFPNP